MKYAFCSTIGGKRHALIVRDSQGLKIALFLREQCLAVDGNLASVVQVQQTNSGDEFTSILTPIMGLQLCNLLHQAKKRVHVRDEMQHLSD